MWWIQGVFFQHRTRAVIRHVPIEGAAVFMEDGIERHMFAGFLSNRGTTPEGDEVISNTLDGLCVDHFGPSSLSEVEVTDRAIRFTKQYAGRRDSIRYSLETRDGISWVGTWEGEAVGSGTARLIMTEVPNNFLSEVELGWALHTNRAADAETGEGPGSLLNDSEDNIPF